MKLYSDGQMIATSGDRQNMCGDSFATSYFLVFSNLLVVAMEAIRLLTGITPILARKAEELSIYFS